MVHIITRQINNKATHKPCFLGIHRISRGLIFLIFQRLVFIQWETDLQRFAVVLIKFRWSTLYLAVRQSFKVIGLQIKKSLISIKKLAYRSNLRWYCFSKCG